MVVKHMLSIHYILHLILLKVAQKQNREPSKTALLGKENKYII